MPVANDNNLADAKEPVWLAYVVRKLFFGFIWSIKYGFIYFIIIPYAILWLLIFPCLLFATKFSVLLTSLLTSIIAIVTILSPLKIPVIYVLYSSVDLLVLHKWVKLSSTAIYQQWWDIVTAVFVIAAIAFAFS